MMRWKGLLKQLPLMVGLFSCVLNSCSTAQSPRSDLEFFENKIRPIFVEHCYECHSQNGESVEAGFNVDSREAILKGGDTGPALIPGDAAASLLIDAVNYRGFYEMPPSSKLPKEKIAMLEAWVNRGAPFPNHDGHQDTQTKEFDLESRRDEHWCWTPIGSPEIPDVDDNNWPLDPMDRFVLSRLVEHDLTPNSDCDRSTWIRRVYFDLVGLPPAPEEIEEFVNDQSEAAYEKVVDGLLESGHFGERWARHWMDLVRYAETCGHEFDYPIEHAYQYRDYLIRAFNDDVPYDDLIREHVAGDLIKNPRKHKNKHFNESVIGTGFWFLGEAVHGPVDVKADEAGRIDNQIDVMCKTFLGLTVACARCHDHKFDAISTKDYYALSGFLQSSRRQVALLDPGHRIQSKRDEISRLVKSGNDLVKSSVADLKSVDAKKWLKLINEAFDNPSESDAELSSQTESSNPFNDLLTDKKIQDAKHPMHVLHWLGNELPMFSMQLEQLGSEWHRRDDRYKNFLAASKLFEGFDNGIPDNWFLTGHAFQSFRQSLNFSPLGGMVEPGGVVSTGQFGSRFQGVMRSPTFELTHDKIAIRAKGRKSMIRLIIDGYVMDVHNALLFNGCKIELVDDQKFTWNLLKADTKNYKGHRAHLEFIDHGEGFLAIDEIRLLNATDPEPVDRPSLLTKKILDQSPQNLDDFRNATARALSELVRAKEMEGQHCDLVSKLIPVSENSTKLKSVASEISELNQKTPKPTRVLAMTDGTPEDEYLFIRGNSNTLGEKVPRQFLTALNTASDADTRFQGSGRLELANRIARLENPLASRVIVNRLWHHLIGQGLVRSVDNFGVLGEKPTHPQLLDYLARGFCDDGWSLKKMIRRIVLSRTYRMSSEINEQAKQIDPENNWLHRAHVKRLEGETIRDSMLQVAGRLDSRMFGPGVPVHLTEFMQGRGRPRASGPLDGERRRSIYLQIRRNFLSPMMLAFDTPIPFNTIGKRHQSNVPAQALILMNDPFVIEQSQQWAENIASVQDSTEEKIAHIFKRAFGRKATEQEIRDAVQFLSSQGKAYDLDPESVMQDPLVWKDLCHVVFNMKEFIYIK